MIKDKRYKKAFVFSPDSLLCYTQIILKETCEKGKKGTSREKTYQVERG